jgi:hypothetical protein
VTDPETGRLLRAWRPAGSAAPQITTVQAFASDYAFLISGVLDLYVASPSTHWLDWVIVLQSDMDAQFWDSTGGGYFFGRGTGKQRAAAAA